uniref:Palmitoyltransferase n=1 Tax=Oryzias latipes TaxID=8090 RepID=A0A3P9LMV9_ORYLA
MHMTPERTVSDGGDILDCIQRGNVEECIEFIQNDRSVIKQQGWAGFTALHYAAIHGNRALVELFLSSGADPNVMSDAGQTAFHFACRQGNIYIMHKMMQYGADLRLRDYQGKTPLHHAVTGGNIAAVHYLWETGMLRFSDTDMFRVTPLHLAASTGNIEVVCYLLKDQRCAVDAVDQQGATAFHIAAERGGVEICWTLLQRAGCRMLHQRNYSGLSPLDLSKQGKTFRHQQLTKLLSRYIREPIHHKPGDSNALYYWTLFFPSLGGAAILLIAAMLGGYGGLICLFLFPWLASSIFSQYHRMATYQRSPNPIYLGTLVAGILHSLLCFYGKMIPSAWPYSTLAQVSVFHFSVLLGMFLRILNQDPGILDKADSDPRFSCIADLVESNQSLQKFCPYCELFQPDFTKHCKLCQVCVKDYDHHCLFLNRCIGRDNHRLFIFFILAMVTSHLLFVAMAMCYLYSKMSEDGRSLSQCLTLLGEEFWVVVMMVLNGMTLFWDAWILIEQFDAVASATTIYFRQTEISERQRSQSQRWAIVLTFLLEGRKWLGSKTSDEDKLAIEI